MHAWCSTRDCSGSRPRCVTVMHGDRRDQAASCRSLSVWPALLRRAVDTPPHPGQQAHRSDGAAAVASSCVDRTRRTVSTQGRGLGGSAANSAAARRWRLATDWASVMPRAATAVASVARVSTISRRPGSPIAPASERLAECRARLWDRRQPAFCRAADRGRRFGREPVDVCIHESNAGFRELSRPRGTHRHPPPPESRARPLPRMTREARSS